MAQMTRKQAEQRVKKLKSFYADLFSFIVVNIFLLVLNLITNPDNLWFYWVTIPWTLGLAFHWFNTYYQSGVLGDDWEEKKIKKYTGKGKEE